MDCLDKFCNLSGQKVSLQKSSICVSNNVSKEVADSIARKAGIPLEKDMGHYLGTLSIHGRVGQYQFQQILEKMAFNMESWKAKFLSMPGRHTLAQSVLSSIPIFLMQSMYLPKGVYGAMDKLI